jgi:hypothetical protein
MSFINPNKAWKGFTVPFWLYEMPGLSANAKLLYSKLAYMAGENGYAWPSQEQLAGELGVCMRSIKRIVKELVDAKLIVVQKKAVGSFLRNCYFFLEVVDGDNLSPSTVHSCPLQGDKNVPKQVTKTSLSIIGRKSKSKIESKDYLGEQAPKADLTAFNFVGFKKSLRAQVKLEKAPRDLREVIVNFVASLEGKIDFTGAALDRYISELADELNTLIDDQKDFSIQLIQDKTGKRKIFGSKTGLLKYAAANPYGTDTFRDAWNRWLDYRASQKIKQYASSESMNRAINKLAFDFGSEANFIASIEQSITKLYQGLFPVKPERATGHVNYVSDVVHHTQVFEKAKAIMRMQMDQQNNQKSIT